MSVDEIETFLAILELGGFQKAAEKLHRSQPAISRRLGQLEARLGAPLLERAASGIALTDAGQAYLPHATAAIAALTDGDAAVRALLEPDRGWVSVALVGTLADTRILTTLREFAARAPSVELRLRTANSREVSELVSRGEVAVGLRYFEDSGEGLVSETVAEEPMVVVAPSTHALAGSHDIAASALRGAPWIGFPPGVGPPESFGPLLERTLAGAGLMDADITAVDSLTAQKRLVEAGFGLGWLPVSSVAEETRIGSLVVLDVPSLAGAVPVTAVRRRNGFLSAAALAFLEALRRDAGS